MSAHKQDAAIEATADGVASEAALFATFYVPREVAPPLYERFRALAQAPETITDNQQDTYEPLLIRSLDLPAAPDTTIIQLGINAPGTATTAWEAARRRLRDILNNLDLPTDWWGYTLIYQAVLSPGVGADSAQSELLPTARRLYSSETLRPLAHDDLSGGRLWLMSIPNRDEGLAAATVYAALSPPDKEQVFKKALLGPALTYLDLIAHKGYSIQRQSRSVQGDYNERLDAFRKTIYQLLGNLEQQVQEPGKLEDLARAYRVFVSFVSELKRLRISIAQQLPNYNSWRAQMEGSNIIEYHHGHLEMAEQELELLVAKGEDALEMAKTAIDMAQTQIDKVRVQTDKDIEQQERERDKAQEKRQLRLEAWLTAVALALALPKLIDRPATWALLGPLGLAPGDMPAEDHADPVHNTFDLLTLLGAQVVIIVAIALLVGLLVISFLGKRRKNKLKVEESH